MKGATLPSPKVPTLPRSISATEHRLMAVQTRIERAFLWLAPCQIPMMSDEGKFPQNVPKFENIARSHRAVIQRVKVDKVQCHSRGACTAENSQREKKKRRRRRPHWAPSKKSCQAEQTTLDGLCEGDSYDPEARPSSSHSHSRFYALGRPTWHINMANRVGQLWL